MRIPSTAASNAKRFHRTMLSPHRATEVVGEPPVTIDIGALLDEQTMQPRDDKKLYVFASMATWCAACKAQIPQFQHLQKQFGPGTLELYGVPVDENDTADKLRQYAETHAPTYQLLTTTRLEQRQLFQEALARAIRSEAMPATLVTDAAGRVLLAAKSVPTLSQLKQAARRRAAETERLTEERP